MKKNPLVLLVLVFTLVFAIAGCADVHKPLYGRWQAVANTDLEALGLGGVIFDFQEGGNLRITIADVSVDMGYAFVNENTIRFTGQGRIAGLLAGQEVTYYVQGERLELTSKGQTLDFDRLSEP